MKKITPNTTIAMLEVALPEINLPAAGWAHVRVGILYAADILRKAVQERDRELGILEEHEEQAPPPRRKFQEHPLGQFTPGVRVSMRGLRRGTDAYRAADAHNREMIRDARRESEIPDEKKTVSLVGLSGRAREKAKQHNAYIYYRRYRAKAKVSRRSRPKMTLQEAGRKGAAAVWARLTRKQRNEKIARMTAARLAAAEKRAAARVNGAA